ncbi:MAG: hypothetical protein KDI03_05380 [Anaerolineae bacterium]|nr:hypothetical protein [Anaerolineae bacterium]MCB0203884.1 hypothetical protein [Anaerolineae bacterium]
MLLISGCLMAISLYQSRPFRWEWLLAGIVFLTATARAGHYATLNGEIIPGCRWPSGMPCFAVNAADNTISGLLGAVGIVITGFLFWRAEYTATGARRTVLRRYLLWLVGLFVITGVVAFSSTYLQLGQVVPYGVFLIAAAILATRMLILLDEDAHTRLAMSSSRRWWLWLAALLVSVVVNSVLFPSLRIPVLALIVLGIGVMAGISSLININGTAAQSGLANEAAILSSVSAQEHEDVREPALQIFLFGPMRVLRDGEQMPNTAETWRSAKTRSLLAFLALRRESGATQIEIVDALWPPNSELDAASERNSLSALRSYFSTLRRVLDPEGPRGSDRFVVHEGERYYLRPDEAWVDVWQFDALTSEAERLLAQEHHTEGLQHWQQATALYSPEGLLPDETYLPTTLLEPIREQLRQRWLLGQRCLAATANDESSALKWWEAIHQAEPLDQEANAWLEAYHHRQGNLSSLRVVVQRRRAAEAEFDLL